MGREMYFSSIADSGAWETTAHMKVVGAERVEFRKSVDTGIMNIIARTANGKIYSEVVSGDPLKAAGRLAVKIKMDAEFGKRRRAFRTKQRSILARR